jgi:hypothetical protein
VSGLSVGLTNTRRSSTDCAPMHFILFMEDSW